MRLLFEIDKKDYDPKGKACVRNSARAIIIKDGKLAVVYSTRNGYCKIPGGGIDENEDPVRAMIREVREETGLVVIPETVKEFGYVHRIQKGDAEPVFIQDNFYYTCDVEDRKLQCSYVGYENDEGFEPKFVSIEDAIRINESYLKGNPNNTMIERELLVMRLLDA